MSEEAESNKGFEALRDEIDELRKNVSTIREEVRGAHAKEKTRSHRSHTSNGFFLGLGNLGEQISHFVEQTIGSAMESLGEAMETLGTSLEETFEGLEEAHFSKRRSYGRKARRKVNPGSNIHWSEEDPTEHNESDYKAS